MVRYLIQLFLVFLCCSCVSLSSVSITQIPKERNKEVSASSSKFIIFGFSFSNEYADEVVKNLKKKCDGGMVQGILTKDENVNYFIGIVMKREITASGYCNKA